MAKAATRKYAPSASKDAKNEMHRYQRGAAKDNLREQSQRGEEP